MEEQNRKEAEEKRRKEAEERRRKEAEEKKRKEAEEKERKNEALVRKKKEADEKRRKEERRHLEEGFQLGRSKAQLREFVARWNSHPNSPYVVVEHPVPGGAAPSHTASGDSLTSMAVLPPTDLNDDDLDDELTDTEAGDEEFTHYTIMVGKAQGQGKADSGGKKEASGRSLAVKESDEAEKIIKQILQVDHRSAYEEYKRMVKQGCTAPLRPEVLALQKEERASSPSRRELKKQPSRDVPYSPEEARRYSMELPVAGGRLSRKPSREDRPPSRDGERAPTHRRPSRDVPLSPVQIERLAQLSDGGAASPDPGTPPPQAWPDMIVAPGDEALQQYCDSLEVPVATLHKSPSGTLLSVPGLTVSPDPEPPKPTLTPPPSPVLNGTSSPTPPPSPTPTHKAQQGTTPPPSPTPAHKIKPASTSPRSLSPAQNGRPALTPPPSPTPSHKDTPFLTPPSSTTSTTSNDKPSSTPPPSPPGVHKGQGSEESPSRMVAWILDIGTPQAPRRPSSGSLQDRLCQWEKNHDGSPRPTPSPSPSHSPSLRRRDRSPLPAEGETDKPAQPARRPQPLFNALTSASSSVEVIQTPWGVLKRSPSRTSLSKSPSMEVPPPAPADSSSTDPKATSPTRQPAQEATPSAAPSTPLPKDVPATPAEGGDRWVPGNKSHTLPRNAKLMKQRSVGCFNAYKQEAGEAGEGDSGLKRKSKFPPSPNHKKKLGPLLFSAQDRISQFENQQQSTQRGPPRPIARTRSNVVLSDTNTQVGFARTRLLGRATRGAPLPEEPTTPAPETPAPAPAPIRRTPGPPLRT